MKKQTLLYIILVGLAVLIVLAFIALNTGKNSSSSIRQASEYEEDFTPDERPDTSNVSRPKSAAQSSPKANSAVEINSTTVVLNLQQRKLDAAKNELLKAVGAAPGSEAAQVAMAANCFISFYESVISDLNKLVPPQELCKGEYCVIESNPPQKIVIRAAGQSLRFSLENPESHGQNLFEIFYRHRKMKVEGTGNMQPDLGYAAYLLFTESTDPTPAQNALKILNEVQAKGSPRDRETVQALKNLFNLQ